MRTIGDLKYFLPKNFSPQKWNEEKRRFSFAGLFIVSAINCQKGLILEKGAHPDFLGRLLIRLMVNRNLDRAIYTDILLRYQFSHLQETPDSGLIMGTNDFISHPFFAASKVSFYRIRWAYTYNVMKRIITIYHTHTGTEDNIKLDRTNGPDSRMNPICVFDVKNLSLTRMSVSIPQGDIAIVEMLEACLSFEKKGMKKIIEDEDESGYFIS